MTTTSTRARKTAPRLTDLPQTYLDCRDLGHSWTYTRDSVLRNRRGAVIEFTRILSCRSCEATAKDVYQVPGMNRVGHRHITYPDGYLIPQPSGGGRVRPAEARRENFARLLARIPTPATRNTA